MNDNTIRLAEELRTLVYYCKEGIHPERSLKPDRSITWRQLHEIVRTRHTGSVPTSLALSFLEGHGLIVKRNGRYSPIKRDDYWKSLWQ